MCLSVLHVCHIIYIFEKKNIAFTHLYIIYWCHVTVVVTAIAYSWLFLSLPSSRPTKKHFIEMTTTLVNTHFIHAWFYFLFCFSSLLLSSKKSARPTCKNIYIHYTYTRIYMIMNMLPCRYVREEILWIWIWHCVSF